MEVVWNQEKQLVELKEKVVREVQEKFSEKNVKMTAGYTAGITRDEEVLLVGGVQYDAAYIVKGVNSAGYSVTLEFPKGVKELKLTLGYKDTKKMAVLNIPYELPINRPTQLVISQMILRNQI